MADKQNAPRDEREAADRVRHWESAIAVHHFTPIRATWQHLADLAGQAALLAESDPNVERRARHDRLARYLARRIANSILREVGRR